MKSPSSASSLAGDVRGGALIEFALVFPVVLALVMGLVDMSVYLWHWTSTVKATQIGVRDAVVRNYMASSPVNWAGDSYRTTDFYAENMGRSCRSGTGALNTAVDPGDFITRSVCPQFTDACNGANCGAGFSQMLARMRLAQPRIRAQHVQVSYASTGLGYVGRRGGPPLTVTVTVSCLTFDLFFLDAWYRWRSPTGDGCPAGTRGVRISAASSLVSEGLNKPATRP